MNAFSWQLYASASDGNLVARLRQVWRGVVFS